jgi:hypothetical protein
MKPPTDWLLDGPAFVRYRTLADFMDKPETDPDVKKSYKEMLADPLVAALIVEVNDWENQPPLTRHNDAAHLLHKLVFLAELGVKKDKLKQAVESILSHQSDEGAFQIRMQIPSRYGGDDIPKWTWVACDAPLVLYSLLSLGFGKNKQVKKAVDHLRSAVSENGYRCFVSPNLGKFRGPGRKDDPCPYVNLIALRAFAQIPELTDSESARTAAGTLLHHWERSRERKLYMFGTGRNFRKLKAPRVWYDIIHAADTLTRFPFLKKDKRLKEMVALLESKADVEGKFIPESIWTRWKGWEFCQKKEPSRWVTLLCHRIFKRMRL